MSVTKAKAPKITADQLYGGRKVTIKHGGKEITGEVLEVAAPEFCFTSETNGTFWTPISTITKLG